ncbi:MAG: tetratricopeptide repeat protein [Cellvibrionaceae bacterium]|nr:tetratricopeptide repeat protein [Cellvibrionaceae bacterium]
MAAHLTEEEQIEALKRWWKDYGTVVLIAAVVGLGGFFAWNLYKSHQVKSSGESASVYEKLASAMTEFDDGASEEQTAKIKQLANDVIAHSSSGLYADFAALYLAKLAVQQQDYAAARTHLEKVSGQGANESVKELARLRLARVLAATGETEQALNMLSVKASTAYAAAYAEAKGDVLLSLQRLVEARTSYEAALQAMGTNQPMRRNLVQLKIDNTRTSSDEPAILPAPVNPHGNLSNPHATGAAAAAEGV